MAIKIEFDKYSEYIWIRTIIEEGIFKIDRNTIDFFDKNGINRKQDVEFKKSNNYIIDMSIKD